MSNKMCSVESQDECWEVCFLVVSGSPQREQEDQIQKGREGRDRQRNEAEKKEAREQNPSSVIITADNSVMADQENSPRNHFLLKVTKVVKQFLRYVRNLLQEDNSWIGILFLFSPSSSPGNFGKLVFKVSTFFFIEAGLCQSHLLDMTWTRVMCDSFRKRNVMQKRQTFQVSLSEELVFVLVTFVSLIFQRLPR